jgi:hypothetical protein
MPGVVPKPFQIEKIGKHTTAKDLLPLRDVYLSSKRTEKDSDDIHPKINPFHAFKVQIGYMLKVPRYFGIETDIFLKGNEETKVTGSEQAS